MEQGTYTENKDIKAEFSFLYVTLRIDLFYNPTKYHSNIQTAAELCSGNQLLMPARRCS